jgi:hypothetical protein
MFFDRRPILTPIPGGQTKQLSVAGCFMFFTGLADTF